MISSAFLVLYVFGGGGKVVCIASLSCIVLSQCLTIFFILWVVFCDVVSLLFLARTKKESNKGRRER